MAEAQLIFCTFPDAEQAERIAEDLVAKRLAACVSISQPVLSIYRWQGKVCRETEVQTTIKTTSDVLEALCARLLELHPYDCPEIVAVPITGGSESYLRWVQEQVASSTQ